MFGVFLCMNMLQVYCMGIAIQMHDLGQLFALQDLWTLLVWVIMHFSIFAVMEEASQAGILHVWTQYVYGLTSMDDFVPGVPAGFAPSERMHACAC